MVPFRAYLFLSSTLPSFLRQKEVKTLMGRRTTRSYGLMMFEIFMLTRLSLLYTALISIFLSSGYILKSNSNFDSNYSSFFSLCYCSIFRYFILIKTAFHLAWMRTICLMMLGVDRKTFFLERSTDIYSPFLPGPPVSCL